MKKEKKLKLGMEAKGRAAQRLGKWEKGEKKGIEGHNQGES